MVKRCVLFASFFLVFNLYLKMIGYLLYEGTTSVYLFVQIVFMLGLYFLGRKLQLFTIRKMNGSDWLIFLSGFVAHLFSKGLTEFITIHSLAVTANSDLDMYALPFFTYISIFAPLLEEMLDRGLIQKGVFSNSYLGVLVSSAIFTYTHRPQDFLSCIPYFLMGLILGYMHKRSDSLTPSILLHMTLNTWFLIQPFVY